KSLCPPWIGKHDSFERCLPKGIECPGGLGEADSIVLPKLTKRKKLGKPFWSALLAVLEEGERIYARQMHRNRWMQRENYLFFIEIQEKSSRRYVTPPARVWKEELSSCWILGHSTLLGDTGEVLLSAVS